MIRLKELREETPLNMRQTAAKLNIPYTTYVSYEKGEREPTSEMLLVLANYFNCSIDYLVGRSKERVDEAMLDKALSIDNDLLQKHGNLLDAQKAQEQRDKSLTAEQLFAETVSKKEIEHIVKYRELDSYGKRAVDGLLQTEYERCTSEPHRTKVIEITFAELKVSAGTGEFLSDDNKSVITISDTPFNRSASYVVQVSGDSMEPEYHDKDMLLVKEQETVEVGEIGIFFLNGDGFVKKYGADRLIPLNEKYDDILLHEYDSFKCFGKVLGKVEKG